MIQPTQQDGLVEAGVKLKGLKNSWIMATVMLFAGGLANGAPFSSDHENDGEGVPPSLLQHHLHSSDTTIFFKL